MNYMEFFSVGETESYLAYSQYDNACCSADTGAWICFSSFLEGKRKTQGIDSMLVFNFFLNVHLL